MMLAKFFNEISLGGLPLRPGITATSFSLLSLDRAEPSCIFNFSA
jgi:hypothetical protein